jgi:hypothetical protein
LAAECRAEHAADASIVTFSKYHRANRTRFGLNELLFDVCVCRTSTVLSASGRHSLHCISEVLLQAESEFASDSKQALFDFNKLVLGSGKQKLFVGPIVDDCDAFMRVLSAPAGNCTGEVFAALVPKPGSWPSLAPMRFFQHLSGSWRERLH